MSPTQEAAMRMALEALEYDTEPEPKYGINAAITALREALAEPVQEPVGFKDAPERIWLQACEDDHCEVPFRKHDEITWCAEQQNPLDVPYVRADLASPPQRPAEPVQDSEWEVRADGKRVRKDRWQIGIRRIVALLWGNRQEFEVDEVVEAVRHLVPNPYAEGDDEALVKAALAEPVQEPAYKVKITGRWHDAEPFAAAFSLPDGEHLLYTAPPQRSATV